MYWMWLCTGAIDTIIKHNKCLNIVFGATKNKLELHGSTQPCTHLCQLNCNDLDGVDLMHVHYLLG